jgi:hypothetical protein
MKQTELSIQTLYPTMAPDYQCDYEEIRLLLATPSRVLLHLERLEAAIKEVAPDDPDLENTYQNELGERTPFDSLEVALLKTERAFGFSDVVYVPPGGKAFSDPNYGGNKILYGDWTAMIQGAHPFRDYGASRPHGEITHRIQWYLLCVACEMGAVSLSTNNQTRVVDLYRATSLEGHKRLYHRLSDDVKYVKSVWSDLFDYGLTKIIDARSTIWIQRELLFCDWRNYFPELSRALRNRFVARRGSLSPSHEENEQFFNGTAVDRIGRRPKLVTPI